jgi:hypothetical protein
VPFSFRPRSYRPRPRSAVIAAVGAVIFVFTFLLRFNDPGGSFAGLTDDHFFYIVRGWQILFGELPVRDFVDHGAPLYYYVGAAVQAVLGRGTLSEVEFSAAMLALAAALTFWVCERATGSIALGLVGTAFQLLLEPRFYNYPKLLAYLAAIPLLWHYADRPGWRPVLWIAVVTVVSFLFRHDHGALIGLSMAVLIVMLTGVPWTQRLKHAAVYALFVTLLMAPYLIFIERNGGLASYLQQAAAWAERDRDRAPVVWPGLLDNPDGVSDEAKEGGLVARAVASVRDNGVAWVYYTEIALPLLALFVLAASRDGFRPSWPQARAKLVMVAVLALALDADFLRSPLAARLADPSVPLAILVAWLLVALPHLALSPKSLAPWAARAAWLARGPGLAAGVAILAVFAVVLSRDLYERLDRSALVERVGKPFERAGNIRRQMRAEWDLNSWLARPDRPELITLSLYVNACTSPDDRVLVQAYLPQVLGLARRAFAGGHADLRPGFFATPEAQQLTLARLRRQHVPIILLDSGKSLENFRESFPLVMAHIDQEYRLADSREFDGRFGVSLFVRKDATPTGTWEPLAWPCYGTGQVSAS